MFFLKRHLLKLAAVALGAGLGCAALFAQTPALPPIKLALVEGLSGGNANGGEAVFRNLVWALERVNDRGGIKTPAGKRLLVLTRYDNKGQTEEALSALRAAFRSFALPRDQNPR